MRVFVVLAVLMNRMACLTGLDLMAACTWFVSMQIVSINP